MLNDPTILIAGAGSVSSDWVESWRDTAWSVARVDSGSEAIALCDENHPDLLIAWTDLPDMSGRDLAKVLKVERGLSDLPILLLASDPAGDPVTSSGEITGALADGVLRLPLDRIDFQMRIRSLLKIRPLTRIEKQSRQQSLLTSLSRKLAEASTPQQAARIILEAADALLGWDSCWLNLYNAGRNTCYPVLSVDLVQGIRQEVTPEWIEEPPAAGVAHVIQNGPQLILRGSANGDIDGLEPFGDENRRSASMLLIPIRHDEETIAVLSIQSYRPNAYTQQDIDILELLAEHCASALQRIRTQESLRHSEKRFASVFRASPTAIAICTVQDGHFIDVNDRYCEFVGFTRDELLGSSVKRLNLWADPNDRQPVMEKLLAEGSEDRVETRFRRKSGELRDVVISLVLIRLDGFHEPVLVAQFSDVTEQRRLERIQKWESGLLEAVSAAISLPVLFKRVLRGLEELIQNCQAMILPADNKGSDSDPGSGPSHFISASEQAIAPEIGMNPGNWSSPAAHRETEIVSDDHSAGDESCQGQRIPPSSAQKYWSRPVRNLHGHVLAVLAICFKDSRSLRQDESQLLERSARILAIAIERDRKEEALRASEERFRSTFTHAATGIAITLPEGKYLDVNAAYCSMLGYSKEELLEGEFADHTHPDDIENNFGLLRELIHGKRISFVLEKRYLHKAGHSIWARVSVSALHDASGFPVSVVAIAQDISSQRAAYEQLALSETLLRIAGEAARLGGWAFELPSKKLMWSDEICRIHELPPGTQPDLDQAVEYYLPEYKATILRHLERCIQQGQPFDVEAELITAKQRHIWVRAIGEAVRDKAGVITRVQGAFQDISARKEVENSLAASEERFRLVSKATNDAIWDWDISSNQLWWSEGFETLFLHNRALIDRTLESWVQFIHPEDRDATVSAVHQIVESDAEFWSGEYRFRRGDGSYAHVSDRGHVLRNKEGHPIRMIGGMTDISDRKEAEEQLWEQATLLDRAQDAILVRDMENRISFWNQSAERLYGWKSDEVMGQSVEGLLYRNVNDFLKATESTVANGEWVGEMEQWTREGSKIVVEGHWSLVRYPDGSPKAILAINTDITQRKRLEDQFLRAQRMESIGTLAGGIAHDLNNVLAPIMMSIDLLKLTITDPSCTEILNTIGKSAERGAEMVKQVLSFARGMEGKRVDVQLKHLVRDFMKMTSETFPKTIQFESSLEDDLWVVQADPTQLQQVLLNLCINARDAMPRGGRVGISVKNIVLDPHYSAMNIEARTGPHVCLEVEDSGQGIPREILDKIFDPFFTTKETGKGTGLGLSTSLAIVKSHGGFIRVYSNVGIGTQFRIYLPARKQTEGEAAAADEQDLPRGQGETILVVDDEAAIREITRQTLETYGYRVLLAANGSEAVSLYVRNQSVIRLVLTDMMMPIMDGPATIVALLRINPSLRILGASGLAANGKVAQASGVGVKHFLPKPYTAEALLTAIRNVLDTPTS